MCELAASQAKVESSGFRPAAARTTPCIMKAQPIARAANKSTAGVPNLIELGNHINGLNSMGRLAENEGANIGSTPSTKPSQTMPSNTKNAQNTRRPRYMMMRLIGARACVFRWLAGYSGACGQTKVDLSIFRMVLRGLHSTLDFLVYRRYPIIRVP